MEFDKNQTEFPSEKHKAVWCRGVVVLPEELSLSEKVKELMDGDLFESCRQMRLFMLHILSDMYENAESYDFGPQQIFHFLLYEVSKSLEPEAYDCINTTSPIWSRDTDVKAKGIYANVMANTGIVSTVFEDKVKITNTLYPKMFRAMKEMQKYVREKKERISMENSFQTCDFRRICSGYKYDKTERRIYMREIEDRIPLILESSAKPAALDFAAYLRGRKINLKWTGIQNNYSQTGKTYGGQGLCYIGLGDTYQGGKKDGWLIVLPLPNIEEYKETLISEGLQHFIWDNIFICNTTPANACNGGEKSIHACQRGVNLTVLDKEIIFACRYRSWKHISVYIHDPDETAINNAKRLLELEQKALAGKSKK